MQTKILNCSMQPLSVIAIVALCILSFLIIRKALQMIFGLIRPLKKRSPQQEYFQNEVTELKKATLQISKEWADIKNLMVPVSNQLSSVADRLDSDLETMGDNLRASIQACLEEECQRNDQRFEQLHRMVDGYREGFDGVREMLQKHEEVMDRLPRYPVTEAWTQTERELLKKRQGLEKDDAVGEQGPHRYIITVIKKSLIEFLKEAKHQMSVQRNEFMIDLKSVFEQLSEDKENLKNTIESAFSTATHQTQTSFLQFGNVGREAMKCIAVLNENTEKTLITKFQESSEKLQGILELIKNLNFDISSVQKTLDNIDGQFDDIYKKLEHGCQKNADCSEEIVKSLKKTTQETNEKSSSMYETCKKLNHATHGIKDMLVNMDNALCNRPAGTTDEISYSTSNAQFTLNRNLSMPNDNFGVFYMTVQICQERLTSMKDQIDQNTYGVQQSAEQLMDELRLLTNLVKNSVETLKNLTFKMPDSGDQADKTYKQEPGEFVGDKFGLDTISEITEESQDDKGWQSSELKKSREVHELVQIIDADLDMALHTKCISGITKNSEFIN